ncbi:hypothetical protein ACIGB8_28790 [Promicromonospora sukumoe]|uniref:hypothetical protein n=1 Tax=Promicromonospora sukumoe TaxID=88382 RepID=UPI0037C9E334
MASAEALARVNKAAETLAAAEDRRRGAQLALRQSTEDVEAARREERQARVDLATELRAEGKNWVEVSEQLGVTPQRARKFGQDNGIA